MSINGIDFVFSLINLLMLIAGVGFAITVLWLLVKIKKNLDKIVVHQDRADRE